MTWVRLDDSFYDHPKIMAVGPLALALHVRALSYCGRHNTDGVVPRGLLCALFPWALIEAEAASPTRLELLPVAGVERLADRLVDAGLWDERADGDFEIHDFLRYNPSRAEVHKKRDAETAKKRRQRGSDQDARPSESRRLSPRDNDRCPPGVSRAMSPRMSPGCPGSPDPDPDPDPKEEKKTPPTPSRVDHPDPDAPHPLPSDWQPWPTTASALEISNGIPAWAVVEIAKRFTAHFGVSGSGRGTEVGWQQRFAKWAVKDWGDPAKRPQRPAEPLSGAAAERARIEAEKRNLADARAKQRALAERYPDVTGADLDAARKELGAS